MSVPDALVPSIRIRLMFSIVLVHGPRASNPQKFSGTEYFSGSEKILGICACLNLEVLSVPKGLVHSIGILEAPGVFLVRRWLRC